ncbi:MAG: hypothetical protein VZT48_09105 [Bulleidia sp.]|nr:hypothetical protein [Bulleidia sp.]
MSTVHAYWIHARKPDPHSISGYFYTRECTCSSCGHQLNMEKDICPFCQAVMDQTAPKDKEPVLEEKKEEEQKPAEEKPADREEVDLLKSILTSYQDAHSDTK